LVAEDKAVMATIQNFAKNREKRGSDPQYAKVIEAEDKALYNLSVRHSQLSTQIGEMEKSYKKELPIINQTTKKTDELKVKTGELSGELKKLLSGDKKPSKNPLSAILEQFTNDYNRSTLSRYDFEKLQLEKQYKEYEKASIDKLKLKE
jgi:hypothetical protein